jgi:hypothetical protein
VKLDPNQPDGEDPNGFAQKKLTLVKLDLNQPDGEDPDGFARKKLALVKLNLNQPDGEDPNGFAQKKLTLVKLDPNALDPGELDRGEFARKKLARKDREDLQEVAGGLLRNKQDNEFGIRNSEFGIISASPYPRLVFCPLNFACKLQDPDT